MNVMFRKFFNFNKRARAKRLLRPEPLKFSKKLLFFTPVTMFCWRSRGVRILFLQHLSNRRDSALEFFRLPSFWNGLASLIISSHFRCPYPYTIFFHTPLYNFVLNLSTYRKDTLKVHTTDTYPKDAAICRTWSVRAIPCQVFCLDSVNQF